MEIDAKIISERRQLINEFNIPLRHIPLVESDIVNHQKQLEEVYKYLLHEASVIDECCRRFKKMFGDFIN